MSTPTTPYGQWSSPITPLSLARALRLRDLAWDTNSPTLVWLEGRSDRGVLLSQAGATAAPRELTPELSVRAQVGLRRRRLYRRRRARLFRRRRPPLPPTPGQRPAHGLSPRPLAKRLLRPYPPMAVWLVYVHSYEGTDRLALVASDGSTWPQHVAEGDDFYMQPCWHPDGRRLAWISWRHPNMPWDGTILTLADLAFDDHGLPYVARTRVIAGDADTAITEPVFSPDGRFLSYMSDASGWDNLYLYDLSENRHLPLVTCDADLGTPAWDQGARTYAWTPDSATIYYSRSESGTRTLWRVQVPSGDTAPVPGLDGYAEFEQPAVSSTGHLAVIASGPQIPPRLLVLSTGEKTVRVVTRRTAGEIVPQETFVKPRPVTWDSAEGAAVHGLLYVPQGAPPDEDSRPPLIVNVHGGPTSQSTAGYNDRAQFFATRGYAFLDLNYRGSTGFGREYRNLLREQWGLFDVDDAVSGARHVADSGLADPKRLVIMGGSAGGYAVLQALVRYPRYLLRRHLHVRRQQPVRFGHRHPQVRAALS